MFLHHDHFGILRKAREERQRREITFAFVGGTVIGALTMVVAIFFITYGLGYELFPVDPRP